MAGTTKKKTTAKKKTKRKIEEGVELRCSDCGTINRIKFYKSPNPAHAHTEHYPICKECLKKYLEILMAKYVDHTYAFYLLCRKFDIYFSIAVFEGAIKMVKKNGWELVGAYFKQMNSFREANGYGVEFAESADFLDQFVVEENEKVEAELKHLRAFKEGVMKNKPETVMIMDGSEREENILDDKNETDVFNILGYDPFDFANEEDKPKMYAKLIDFLDEDTQNDGFKVDACIEIVVNWNEIEKINKALVGLDIVSKAGERKTLNTIKKELIKSNLDMAKDNGISINHSNNKSKGAGTLSGILKNLQEKNLDESDVNIFDIGTCEGMRQVADISNRSILEQIMLDENSYTEMLKEQRDLIEEYRAKSEKLEEELRLSKIEFKELYLKVSQEGDK